MLRAGDWAVSLSPGPEALGARLRRARLAAPMTLEELANRSGVSVRAISDLERARTRKPYPRTVRLLIAALGLPLCADDDDDLVPSARHPDRSGATSQLLPALGSARMASAQLSAPVQEFAGREGELGELGQQQILAEGPVRAAPDPSSTASAEPGAVRTEPIEYSDRVIPRQLPPQGTFAGRVSELAALTRLLDEVGAQIPGMVVISAIGGTAGVGKTTLAVRWAHKVAPRFGDGQLYVNLRGFDHADAPAVPAGVIRGFLDALGVPLERIPASLDTQVGLFRSLLAGKNMLIVLDNARDEQQVRPLLPAGPGCLVVVTSRRQLAGLAAADGARLLTLDLPSHAEAVQMLTLRLGAGRAAAEPDAVDQLAGLCARLPLALAVAAARAHTRPGLSLAALAAELSDMTGRLDALDAGDPAVSVRAVLSWSCLQLSPEAARMFRLLGLHPGPDISLPAAASLTATALPAAGRALRELTAANLLTEHVPGRFTSHDLLRAYAAERAQALDGEADLHAALRRVLDHYLQTCLCVSRLLYPAWPQLSVLPAMLGAQAEPMTDLDRALAWIQAERHVLMAAIALAAAAGFDDHACQLPLALELVFYRRGWWHDLQSIQQTALEAATRLGSLTGQAHALRSLGQAQAMADSLDEGVVHISRALLLFQDLGDDFGCAIAHECMSFALGRHGRHRDALGHARESKKFYHAAGHRVGQASALNNIGYLHAELGDHPRALAYCQRSVRAFRELADRRGEAIALGSLGRAYHQLGQYAQALDCYRQALTVIGQLGDRHSQADICTHLGETYHAVGDDIAARQAWTEALSVYEEQNPVQASQLRARLRSLR
jgi:tetratricopeptide (TPR) repeat protein/transcriptional regulator with XRE-family HTH domain